MIANAAKIVCMGAYQVYDFKKSPRKSNAKFALQSLILGESYSTPGQYDVVFNPDGNGDVSGSAILVRNVFAGTLNTPFSGHDYVLHEKNTPTPFKLVLEKSFKKNTSFTAEYSAGPDPYGNGQYGVLNCTK